LKPNENITLLIGPEGDFSEKKSQWQLTIITFPVSLGNTRLRTETAAIVACHVVSMKNSFKNYYLYKKRAYSNIRENRD
jgi:16S rRNA (uracil1498-N3)-methyltransferase